MQVFEKVILLTHNTHHVQFLIWYLCSLRPKLAEVFVKYLWQLVGGVHVAPITRQSAVSYISSFLARANFIRIEYVFQAWQNSALIFKAGLQIFYFLHYFFRYLRSVLQDMSDWIHSYINNQDGQMNVDMRMHTVFYSVCQALFYLLCFRHKELFRTKQSKLNFNLRI